MIIGIIGIVIFYLPTLKKGIFNAGTVIGLVLSLIVFGLSIYSWIFSLGFMIFLMILALLLIVVFFLITKNMIKASSRLSDKAQTVIVLGCKVINDRPSEMLMDRIKLAAIYLKKHPGATCIATGGVTKNNNISEAECIKRELMKRGIDATRIYIEEESMSTRENMVKVKKIIDLQKLSNKVAICTNEYHVYRAMFFASKVDIRACALPVKTPWWIYPTFYVREVAATTVALIKK